MTIEFPIPPLDHEDGKEHRRLLGQSVQGLMSGKSNNILDVTLTASQASTTVEDARLTFSSVLLPMPRTANAAAEIGNGTMYVADSGRVNGEVTITHANNAQTDRDFYFVIVG